MALLMDDIEQLRAAASDAGAGVLITDYRHTDSDLSWTAKVAFPRTRREGIFRLEVWGGAVGCATMSTNRGSVGIPARSISDVVSFVRLVGDGVRDAQMLEAESNLRRGAKSVIRRKPTTALRLVSGAAPGDLNDA